MGALAVVGQKASSHDETWKPVYGERNSIRDHYNQLTVDLRETAAPHRLLWITFRVYDEGVAFCYTIPKLPVPSGVTMRVNVPEFKVNCVPDGALIILPATELLDTAPFFVHRHVISYTTC